MDDREPFILRLKSGDPDAFEELVERFGSRLTHHARSLTRNTALSEELVADTFTEAWSGIKGFRGESGIIHWLLGILVNRFRLACRHSHRKSTLLQKYTPPAAGQEGEGTGLLDAFREVLPDLLDDLSADHREVVVLRYLEGMKLAEIAQTLNIPEGTAKSRLFLATAKMRKFLKGMNFLEGEVT